MRYTATSIAAKDVIPAKAGIQKSTGFPPYQVRGRLSQARNDKLYKSYAVTYKIFDFEL